MPNRIEPANPNARIDYKDRKYPIGGKINKEGVFLVRGDVQPFKYQIKGVDQEVSQKNSPEE